MSLANIFEKLKLKLAKDGSTSTIEIPVVRKLLELMRCDAAGIISKVPFTEEVVGGPMYMVDMNAIISTIKQKPIHSIVSEKLGIPSARILELLMRKKYLDQTQVGSGLFFLFVNLERGSI